jgi:hypothetical protein
VRLPCYAMLVLMHAVDKWKQRRLYGARWHVVVGVCFAHLGGRDFSEARDAWSNVC